ncbi:hypothetical protein PYK79_26950 [Streptomyces sp. ID05-04B]|uniref:hypothetical protein n=1 Tax=unclassified Streptomyces TaxID=2593676 RepID=UPI000D1AA75A|nr:MULTISPECIES: hypothetical protein [unclassified Streptomyces]AVV43958.1 hypothetical protein C6376_23415 [Streptomyces sp. P3]MDX5566237.1 hypothetical protein [Streptomyces sp. ID05-04B]
MRSARMILATAAASAALAIGAPGAFAADGDWDHDSSSHSKEDGSWSGKEHGKEDHGKQEHGKGEHGKGEHDGPHGGMHTGGGALTAVNQDGDRGAAKDPRFDPETYKDKDKDWGTAGTNKEEHGSGSGGGGKEESGGWSGKHEKPSGGMHTGGGALAGPSVTATGLGVLAVAGTGLYALRRRKTAGGVA